LQERECVLLSALLQNIGKVYQRTGLPAEGYEDFISEDVGEYGEHAKWTGSFFSKYIPEHFREAGYCALYHHTPQTPLQQYVSAAYDLVTEKREERRDSTPSTESVPSEAEGLGTGSEVTPGAASSDIERLTPVANYVFLKNAKKTPPEYRYPLKPLSLERRDVMPKLKEDEAFKRDLTEEYNELWAAFTAEMDQLNEQQNTGEMSVLTDQDFEAYFFTLYFLLKKYFLRVPSVTRGSSPDISLFDHARVTAALADCLYMYHQEKKEKESPPTSNKKKEETSPKNHSSERGEISPSSPIKKGGEEEFLLIEGDVSGIQKFIFNMVSPQQERARLAKRLRGRSFYLLLLTETLADYVLKKLDLTIVHQLWCTGGHFFIIAPNTPTMTYHLKAAYKDINDFLVKEFHGELGCVLSWEAVSGEDLANDVYEVRQRLTQKTEREKRRKLYNVLDDEKNLHFPSQPPERKEGKETPDYAASVDKHVQALNDLYENIGEKLPKIDEGYDRLAKIYKPGPEIPNDNFLTEFNIGKTSVSWAIYRGNCKQADTMYLLNTLDDKKFRKTHSIKCGFKFIATHVDTYQTKDEIDWHNRNNPDNPAKEGETKCFGCMAKEGKGGFLGVLRMDLDHLGMVFNIGIKDQSIARIASLSSDIELFFTGYFQKLCETPTFKKNTYVAYSGGDDLFVIGAWDIILDLACTVREDFKAFTCQNEDMNISGGLFLCKGKYPIHRAAEQAKHLLDDLAKDNTSCEKNLKEEITQRDALAVFNHRLSWKEFLALKKIGEEFVEAIQKETLSRTYLYKLLDLHNTWKTHRTLNIARLYYITIRNIKHVQFSEQIISKHQYLSNQSYMPILVSYTALKTRKEKEGEIL
jgi:CRISPR-associated protein Csm1